MALQPKKETGLPPFFSSTFTNHRSLDEMSISELIEELRSTVSFDQYDIVEKVLVARDESLKAEIASLQVKVEVERMNRLQAEEALKKKEQLCQKGKRAQECYENLLKEVKKNGLVHKNINTSTRELRDKNCELESENYELKKLKKKWLDDSNVVADLTIRVGNLEYELEATKKNCEDEVKAAEELWAKSLAEKVSLEEQAEAAVDRAARAEADLEVADREVAVLRAEIDELKDEVAREKEVVAKYEGLVVRLLEKFE